MHKSYCSFHDYVEFSKANNGGDGKKGDSHSSHKIDNDPDGWYGDAPDYETMYNRCYDGYNAKNIGEARDKMKAQMVFEKPQITLREAGEELDVPTFLSGDNKCFWHDDEAPSRPRIHLIYPMGANSGVDSEAFILHGGAVTLIADILAENAEIKISAYFCDKAYKDDNNMLQVVELKEYAESIDIPRLGAVTHPSWFRRITFGWLEHHDTDWGYGREVSMSDRHDEFMADDEFYDWIRISDDEFIVDLSAPSAGDFRSDETALEYAKRVIDNVDKLIDEGEESEYKAWK